MGNGKILLLEDNLRDDLDFKESGYFVVDINGNILECNSSFTEIYGLKSFKLSNEFNLKQANPKDWGNLIKELEKTPIIREYQLTQRWDGRTIHVLANFEGILSENGQLGHIRGYIKDETQHVEAEKSMIKSEQLLFDIIDFLPDSTFVIDQDGKVIIWNQAIEKKTSVPKEDILGKGNYAHSIPAYGKRRPSLIDLIKDYSPEFSSKYDFIRKEGRTLFAEVFAPLVNNGNGAYLWMKASPLLDDKGEQCGAIESIRDITDYKESLKALQKSEKRLKAIMESVVDVIITTDLNGNILFCNDSIMTIFGYDPGEIIGRNMTLLMPERHKELHLKGSGTFKISKKLWRSPGRIKMIGTRKDRTEFPFEISLAMWKSEGKEYTTAIIRDITEQEKAEKALFESEKKYRELVDYSLVAIYETTLNGEILFANNAMIKMFEYDNFEDLKSNNIIKLYKNPTKRKEFVKILKGNSYLTQYEITGISKNGKIINTIVNAKLHNNIVSGMIIDISKAKQTERALRESEDKYRTLFESDPDYTILLGLDGVLLDINPAAEQVIDLSRDELLGKHFLELDVLFKENFDKYINLLDNVKKHGDVGSFETEIMDKNGEIRWIRIISTIINKGKKNGYILVIGSDITERKLAEEELKSSLKEKDLLIKEIHHRVKNNLQIITSLLDLQKPYVNEDPIALNVLKGSKNRVISMAMIHEMLYQSKDINHINISSYTQNLITYLFHSYASGNDIKPVLNIEDFYMNIETSTPLGLIISELVSNSLKHAFPERKAGEITITLQNHNTYFELTISDNGIGFPEDIDFRNIKSSLGLKLVNSLINQLDGTIELDKSQGTQYTIKFKELEYEKRV